MYRISICDDDKRVCGQIEQIILDYAQSILLKITIDVFFTAEELYKYLINNGKYDIIFLDIELKELNGIELGVLIRNELKNQFVNIVYVSSHKSYIEEMFHASPQNFISKPIRKKRVIEVFQNLIDLCEDNEQDFFVYQIGREIYRIAVKDIIYFRVEKRTIHIKTVTGEDFFYGAIKNINEKLKHSNFFMANRNCLINYKYVSCFAPNEICLVTNEIIPLGINKYKELVEIQKEIESRYNIGQHFMKINNDASIKGER